MTFQKINNNEEEIAKFLFPIYEEDYFWDIEDHPQFLAYDYDTIEGIDHIIADLDLENKTDDNSRNFLYRLKGRKHYFHYHSEEEKAEREKRRKETEHIKFFDGLVSLADVIEGVEKEIMDLEKELDEYLEIRRQSEDFHLDNEFDDFSASVNLVNGFENKAYERDWNALGKYREVRGDYNNTEQLIPLTEKYMNEINKLKQNDWKKWRVDDKEIILNEKKLNLEKKVAKVNKKIDEIIFRQNKNLAYLKNAWFRFCENRKPLTSNGKDEWIELKKACWECCCGEDKIFPFISLSWKRNLKINMDGYKNLFHSKVVLDEGVLFKYKEYEEYLWDCKPFVLKGIKNRNRLLIEERLPFVSLTLMRLFKKINEEINESKNSHRLKFSEVLQSILLKNYENYLLENQKQEEQYYNLWIKEANRLAQERKKQVEEQEKTDEGYYSQEEDNNNDDNQE